MVPRAGEAPPDEALLLRVLRRPPTSLPVSGLNHSLGLISNIGNKSRQSRV